MKIQVEELQKGSQDEDDVGVLEHSDEGVMDLARDTCVHRVNETYGRTKQEVSQEGSPVLNTSDIDKLVPVTPKDINKDSKEPLTNHVTAVYMTDRAHQLEQLRQVLFLAEFIELFQVMNEAEETDLNNIVNKPQVEHLDKDVLAQALYEEKLCHDKVHQTYFAPTDSTLVIFYNLPHQTKAWSSSGLFPSFMNIEAFFNSDLLMKLQSQEEEEEEPNENENSRSETSFHEGFDHAKVFVNEGESKLVTNSRDLHQTSNIYAYDLGETSVNLSEVEQTVCETPRILLQSKTQIQGATSMTSGQTGVSSGQLAGMSLLSARLELGETRVTVHGRKRESTRSEMYTKEVSQIEDGVYVRLPNRSIVKISKHPPENRTTRSGSSKSSPGSLFDTGSKIETIVDPPVLNFSITLPNGLCLETVQLENGETVVRQYFVQDTAPTNDAIDRKTNGKTVKNDGHMFEPRGHTVQTGGQTGNAGTTGGNTGETNRKTPPTNTGSVTMGGKTDAINEQCRYYFKNGKALIVLENERFAVYHGNGVKTTGRVVRRQTVTNRSEGQVTMVSSELRAGAKRRGKLSGRTPTIATESKELLADEPAALDIIPEIVEHLSASGHLTHFYQNKPLGQTHQKYKYEYASNMRSGEMYEKREDGLQVYIRDRGSQNEMTTQFDNTLTIRSVYETREEILSRKTTPNEENMLKDSLWNLSRGGFFDKTTSEHKTLSVGQTENVPGSPDNTYIMIDQIWTFESHRFLPVTIRNSDNTINIHLSNIFLSYEKSSLIINYDGMNIHANSTGVTFDSTLGNNEKRGTRGEFFWSSTTPKGSTPQGSTSRETLTSESLMSNCVFRVETISGIGFCLNADGQIDELEPDTQAGPVNNARSHLKTEEYAFKATKYEPTTAWLKVNRLEPDTQAGPVNNTRSHPKTEEYAFKATKYEPTTAWLKVNRLEVEKQVARPTIDDNRKAAGSHSKHKFGHQTAGDKGLIMGSRKAGESHSIYKPGQQPAGANGSTMDFGKAAGSYIKHKSEIITGSNGSTTDSKHDQLAAERGCMKDVKCYVLNQDGSGYTFVNEDEIFKCGKKDRNNDYQGKNANTIEMNEQKPRTCKQRRNEERNMLDKQEKINLRGKRVDRSGNTATPQLCEKQRNFAKTTDKALEIGHLNLNTPLPFEKQRNHAKLSNKTLKDGHPTTYEHVKYELPACNTKVETVKTLTQTNIQNQVKPVPHEFLFEPPVIQLLGLTRNMMRKNGDSEWLLDAGDKEEFDGSCKDQSYEKTIRRPIDKFYEEEIRTPKGKCKLHEDKVRTPKSKRKLYEGEIRTSKDKCKEQVLNELRNKSGESRGFQTKCYFGEGIRESKTTKSKSGGLEDQVYAKDTMKCTKHNLKIKDNRFCAKFIPPHAPLEHKSIECRKFEQFIPTSVWESGHVLPALVETFKNYIDEGNELLKRFGGKPIHSPKGKKIESSSEEMENVEHAMSYDSSGLLSN
ncbi:hypothetical protein WDU94_002680 [Cyamophila willieti]